MPLTKEKTIAVPAQLVKDLLERSEGIAELHDELEDFYLSRNPKFLRSLREARREHLDGKVVPFAMLKKKYV